MVPTAHKRFSDGVISRLEGDARILGLGAGGSWIQGDMDEFSDLDFVVVTDPGRYTSVLRDAKAIAHSLGPCLSCFPADHLGLPNILICLFEDPLLHVDLNFVSLDDFPRRTENPVVLWERDGALTKIIEEHKPAAEKIRDLQWMEDRFWTWIHYGAQRLGRGELYETLDFLSFLRAQVLAPLLAAKKNLPPRGMRKVERYSQREDLDVLRTTVPDGYDPRECERALRASAKMYVGLRETLAQEELERNRRAEMSAMSYLHEVSEKLK